MDGWLRHLFCWFVETYQFLSREVAPFESKIDVSSKKRFKWEKETDDNFTILCFLWIFHSPIVEAANHMTEKVQQRELEAQQVKLAS